MFLFEDLPAGLHRRRVIRLVLRLSLSLSSFHPFGVRLLGFQRVQLRRLS
jgi:hypothetical protein